MTDAIYTAKINNANYRRPVPTTSRFNVYEYSKELSQLVQNNQSPAQRRNMDRIAMSVKVENISLHVQTSFLKSMFGDCNIERYASNAIITFLNRNGVEEAMKYNGKLLGNNYLIITKHN